MHRQIELTILVDNVVRQRGLLAEHGWAVWLLVGDAVILFDTGQGLALAHNADEMGLNLRDVTHLALSHGHYDHTGGLAANLEAFEEVELFAHPAAFGARYSRRGPCGCDATTPPIHSADQLVNAGLRVNATAEWTVVVPGVWLTGAIPRAHPLEDVGGTFHRDAARTEPDQIPDDQALVIETVGGLVIVLGCAHAGVINTLDHVAARFLDMPIHAVVGGMHLLHADPPRVDATLERLRVADPAVLMPTHCTGAGATRVLATMVPTPFREGSVGTGLRLPVEVKSS